MSKSTDYIGKRQMKAVTIHGKHHSTTVSGNAWGIFPETLDLEQKETKRRIKKIKPKEMLENMMVSIDLIVKDMPHSKSFIQKLTDNIGIVRIKKDFEVLSTTEKLIRAFAKAKFKNVATIELDGDVLYNHPEIYYDTDEAIEALMYDIHQNKREGNIIFLKMLSKQHKDCEVNVKVSRVHMPWVHDILIKIKGELPEEFFRRIINYLEENLEIEKLMDEWKRA